MFVLFFRSGREELEKDQTGGIKFGGPEIVSSNINFILDWELAGGC